MAAISTNAPRFKHTINTLQSGQTTVQNKHNPSLRLSNTEGVIDLSAPWTAVKRLQDNEDALQQEKRQLREEVLKLQDADQ